MRLPSTNAGRHGPGTESRFRYSGQGPVIPAACLLSRYTSNALARHGWRSLTNTLDILKGYPLCSTTHYMLCLSFPAICA